MKNDPPRVSILLPVYNGARFLERAIGSVLKQTFKRWELIVVDDGSRDASAAIVRAAAAKDGRVRYVFQANSGIQKALNHGLALSRGEYIARIDDDDVWLGADKLELQVQFLDKFSDHVLLGTGVCVIDETGKEIFRYLPPEDDMAVRAQILKRNCFAHSSVMFRRDSVGRLGGYSESQETRHAEDYDLWLRIGRLGKLANLPVYSTGFTLRPDNISSQNKTEQFVKDLRLARAYKHDYPGYLSALTYGYLRLFGYKVFRILPRGVQNIILKSYKEF